MTLQLTHYHHDAVDVSVEERLLFTYVYNPDTPQKESSRPYMHPICSLAGDEVTIFRPYDHLWHKGISMTLAALSGQNFWGGPTYVRDQGYVQLANNGVQRHNRWDEVTCDEKGVRLAEALTWLTQAGEAWIDEKRIITVPDVDPEADSWRLTWSTQLANCWDRPLIFGSPTTEGRPNAGYGGLFWRGPRSFLHGQARAAGALAGEEIMGQAANWLAYSGLHDGTGNRSTLLFLDHPQNPRYPTKWFMRQDPFACASFAFSFDQELTLEPGESLAFTYQIVIANGELSEDEIQAAVEASV